MKTITNFIFYIIFFTFSISRGFTQCKIIDAQTNQAIANVHVISQKGILVGTSDINGLIHLPLSLKDSLEFSHIAYEKVILPYSAYQNKKKINLEPSINSLDEIVISAEKKDFVVIKGFFISYQLDDKIPKAYMDGLVEYYVPLSDKKSFKFKLISNRSFKNKALFSNYIRDKGMVKITSDNRTGVPYLDFLTIYEDFEKYNKVKFENSIMLSEGNQQVGKVETKSNQILAIWNKVTPSNSYKKTVFGNEFEFINISITENYINSTSNLKPFKEDLLFCRKYIKQKLGHKKLPNQTVEVETFHEFYALSKKYISKFEYKEIADKNSFFGPIKSNKLLEYDELVYSKIPSYIQKLLYNKLEEW